MKTAEELKTLKEEFETLNKKLADLTDDELTQISSGYPKNSCLMCRAGQIEEDPKGKPPVVL